jgi:hypothetical protein
LLSAIEAGQRPSHHPGFGAKRTGNAAFTVPFVICPENSA